MSILFSNSFWPYMQMSSAIYMYTDSTKILCFMFPVHFLVCLHWLNMCTKTFLQCLSQATSVQLQLKVHSSSLTACHGCLWLFLYFNLGIWVCCFFLTLFVVCVGYYFLVARKVTKLSYTHNHNHKQMLGLAVCLSASFDGVAMFCLFLHSVNCWHRLEILIFFSYGTQALFWLSVIEI